MLALEANGHRFVDGTFWPHTVQRSADSDFIGFSMQCVIWTTKESICLIWNGHGSKYRTNAFVVKCYLYNNAQCYLYNNHYSSQWVPVTRSILKTFNMIQVLCWLNIWRLGLNGCHSVDIFKSISLNVNYCILIQFSLSFSPVVQLSICQHWLR